MVKYQKGHKNSKGESAPWTIVSCKTGKVLSSYKSKDAADEHLDQMEYFKHVKNESVDELDKLYIGYIESVCEAVGCKDAVAPLIVGFGLFREICG